MKINRLLINIFIILSISFNALSEDIEFDASKINITDDGNLIEAINSETKIISKKIKIQSNIARYNKKKNIIEFKNNVKFVDDLKNIKIFSDNLIFKKKINTAYSYGETLFYIKDNYEINSEYLIYELNNQKLISNVYTEIKDKDQNTYIFNEKFIFDLQNELIKSKKAKIVDKNGNKYEFEDLIVNLKTNEIVGKELIVNFEKSYFGNNKNDPVLKGRGAISNEDKLEVYNAVFSTCNIEKKNCRGWELNTSEFKHDKLKKIFEYKGSWLKIFGIKAFYMPYFYHPDPTVKRKSGFLTPSYSSSDSLGTSINLPYFKILSIDKDITFSPRYYADKSFLLQNEYRQVLQNSDVKSDFSFLLGEEGTKSHFFYNQIGEIRKNLDYEINLQNVKGDNYLKTHNLMKTSSLIKNDSLLSSNLDLNWQFKNSNLNTSFKIFEDLSRNYHDRYQYIFPDFNFYKKIDIPENYNGTYDFNSYGYNKNYDTNIMETVITNDFKFKSNNYVNSYGLTSNYDLLVKNSNSYSKNSTNFEENSKYNLYSILKVETSLPLIKEINSYSNYLTPKISLMYSPNGNKNLSDKDILLNYNSVFNLNRIGTTSEVEGGESLSLGLEYKKLDRNDDEILALKIANVLKPKENINLPIKSGLNKTRSDIFGNLRYKINDNLKLGYVFSYDRDLRYSNLDGLNLDYSVNNFSTNFYYYTEDYDLNPKETIQNKSKFKIDKENYISFSTSKDLKDDFTQYYDLTYEYITDCISLSFNYNKSFYRDGSLEPNKSLSFLIKIIPFTELGVSNVGNIVKN